MSLTTVSVTKSSLESSASGSMIPPRRFWWLKRDAICLFKLRSSSLTSNCRAFSTSRGGAALDNKFISHWIGSRHTGHNTWTQQSSYYQLPISKQKTVFHVSNMNDNLQTKNQAFPGKQQNCMLYKIIQIPGPLKCLLFKVFHISMLKTYQC